MRYKQLVRERLPLFFKLCHFFIELILYHSSQRFFTAELLNSHIKGRLKDHQCPYQQSDRSFSRVPTAWSAAQVLRAYNLQFLLEHQMYRSIVYSAPGHGDVVERCRPQVVHLLWPHSHSVPLSQVSITLYTLLGLTLTRVSLSQLFVASVCTHSVFPIVYTISQYSTSPMHVQPVQIGQIECLHRHKVQTKTILEQQQS